MTLVDTAEMYGDGGAEEVVGAGDGRAPRRGLRRQQGVSAQRRRAKARSPRASAACSGLRTDRLDLYLLHWRGRIPLAETVDAFERLQRDGKILRWGVSNFDTADIEELLALPDGARCAVNQVLYHLGERGIEWSLAAMCRRHAIAVMAYSPVGEGALLREPQLAAHRALDRCHRGASRACVAASARQRHRDSADEQHRAHRRESRVLQRSRFREPRLQNSTLRFRRRDALRDLP